MKKMFALSAIALLATSAYANPALTLTADLDRDGRAEAFVVSANGSVLLNTSHVGIGRSPHEQTLTIAYRGGTYQVVGLTRANWDRIEPDSSTSCDLNLLTGQGKVNSRSVRRALRAMPVTAWKWDGALPAGCTIQ